MKAKMSICQNKIKAGITAGTFEASQIIKKIFQFMLKQVSGRPSNFFTSKAPSSNTFS